MKRLIYLVLVTALALFALGQTLQGVVLNSCDQWANYYEAGYYVYNNIWGTGAGPQCIVAETTTKWTATSTQSGDGVKSYPNSSREPLGVTIGSISSLTSSMNTTSPGTGVYCTAWDIWAPTEIMIWINKYGGAAPWGSFVETAVIGGITWDVYKNGYPGFVLQNNVNSMTVDIKSILDYCVTKGWLASSNLLKKVQGGFEITSTNGVASTFTMNSFSVSITSSEPLEVPPAPAPASETAVTGVWYKVLNGKSGKAMQVTGASTADRASVEQAPYTGALNQQWALEDLGNGYLKITNRNSGKCLQVTDWNTADGGLLSQTTYADYQNNEMWTIVKDGIYYQIINRNSSKLVDVQSASLETGALLHQWTLYTTDAASQRWSFIAVGSAPTPTGGTATRTATATTVTRTSTVTATATAVTRTATATTVTRTGTRTATTVTRTATATRTSTTLTRTATRTATSAATATVLPTTGGTGCICDSGCSTLTVITPDFAKDGAGQFCYEAASLGSYINSWNLTSLKVNGVDFTNKYIASASYPAAIGGKYYVYYNSTVAYGHFEAKN